MIIEREVFEKIVAQAREELPNESCGYLLGNDNTVTENYRMTNADHSPEHFSFIPKEQYPPRRPHPCRPGHRRL